MIEVTALIAAVLMAAAGLIHAFWAFGGVWPAADGRALAKAVTGEKQERMPDMAACLIVFALLASAAVIVSDRAGLLDLPGPNWIVTVGAWVIVAVLAARGLVGLITSLWARRATRYQRLDVAVYSPLCLVIAALCLPAAIG